MQNFMTFIISVGAVTLAEMGDKTQLLAMCFATRFKASKVLLGVFLATVLNHAVAVVAGYLLKEVLSAYTAQIQMIASVSFLGFALWTIRGDSVDESCDTKKSFGPVLTVAIAFFFAEMGDKTQLTTVSLAAGLANPYVVLMGTTAGMLVADGIGIIFGVVMNKKIPEKKLKWISAVIFALCGVAGYLQAGWNILSKGMLFSSTVFFVAVTVLIGYVIVKRGGNEGVFEEIAAMNRKNDSDK